MLGSTDTVILADLSVCLECPPPHVFPVPPSLTCTLLAILPASSEVWPFHRDSQCLWAVEVAPVS